VLSLLLFLHALLGPDCGDFHRARLLCCHCCCSYMPCLVPIAVTSTGHGACKKGKTRVPLPLLAPLPAEWSCVVCHLSSLARNEVWLCGLSTSLQQTQIKRELVVL